MLTVILGPMKAGKTDELISRVAPWLYTKKTIQWVKPNQDRRTENIFSRTGKSVEAVSVDSLTEVGDADIFAIDEFHMYPASDITVIEGWLSKNKNIFISGLNAHYTGELFPINIRLLELVPDKIIVKRAVCDVCFEYEAKYTQILNQEGVPYTSGLGRDLTEDGRYQYETRCRKCFVLEPRW